MAASDPATDVPTPTGTLQGVAAFSWDGTAWQPSGRAGPSVATPTGVLRGVAAFNGGPSWQPTGRAQPGVATPSGVLDGVAVYTWSGSAWTPPGGQATPSTASGALRGVAAFNWDGTTWQPAGQAGPSVATPYGALDGVAMFNWTGSAWAATGAPSLSLDFMTPGTLDPRITFTRASTATYFDAAGTMQTATTNTPRWDYDPVTHALRGLLIEEARTNVLLNSATLGTQSVTVTAQAYTLSFYGTGTITKSGTASGALVGTGATQRVSQTFTPTAGTLTLTVTGSVLNAQLEAGSFQTSYIPTTAAAVTRSADSASMPIASWYTAAQGSLQVEYIVEGAALGYGGPIGFVGANEDNEDIIPDRRDAGGTPTAPTINTSVVTAGGTISGYAFYTSTPLAAGTHRGAIAWLIGGAVNAAHDSVLGGPIGATTATPPAITSLALRGVPASQPALNQWLCRVRYWPRALSNTELQAVTT